jgi:hypothetical protein
MLSQHKNEAELPRQYRYKYNGTVPCSHYAGPVHSARIV